MRDRRRGMNIADIRYVNQLEDDDYDKKETRNTLKMLREFAARRNNRSDVQDQM